MLMMFNYVIFERKSHMTPEGSHLCQSYEQQKKNHFGKFLWGLHAHLFHTPIERR